MKPTVTETKTLLRWADQTCMCESYYSYTCSKCRDIGEGYTTKNATVIDFCLEEGLIVRDKYSTYKVTPRGRAWAK